MRGFLSPSQRYAGTLAITLSVLIGSTFLKAETAKNIVLFISDGCGYNHIDAASIYQYGGTGTQVYERFPVQYGVSTYMVYVDSLGNTVERGYDPVKAWDDFGYVTGYYTCSAAAATAMSTGIKTSVGALGVDPKRQPLRHIAELAEDLEKATGVVASVQLSHATPAGFLVHNVSRHNYIGIAREMILSSPCDVILGCGHPFFDDDGRSTTDVEYKYVGGKGVWRGLREGAVEFDVDCDGIVDTQVSDADGDGVADPWTFIQARSEFEAFMVDPPPKRVIGVPQIRSTLQCNRSGPKGKSDVETVETPFSTPFHATVPTLEEMTRVALNVLDNDQDGFFLMVEGGAVDWAGHDWNSARTIEEQIDFNRSVETVVLWVEVNSSWDETLVIVTGDHETGYLTGPGSGPVNNNRRNGTSAVWNSLYNNGRGNLPGMEWHRESHTNSLIPLYAKGVGSERFHKCVKGNDPVRGPYVDNTDVARVMWESFK